MKNHTKTPWEIQEYKRNLFQIVSGEIELALIDATEDPMSGKVAPREEALANLKLMAAAPELLSCCKYLVELIGRECSGENALYDSQGYISKIAGPLKIIAKAEANDH
jgi:hypothetical protein